MQEGSLPFTTLSLALAFPRGVGDQPCVDARREVTQGVDGTAPPVFPEMPPTGGLCS